MQASQLLLGLLLPTLGLGCTTMAAGRLATADGSVLVSQSDDGDGNIDARLVTIPAADHPPNATRPIYPLAPAGYPRFIGSRSPLYRPGPGEVPTPATGHIPQVPSTFAYYEGDYGLLNERGVGIGESSCSARILAPPAGPGGLPLLPIEELSRIGLERASSSRQAVALMGALAERYGFYGVLRQPGALSDVPNEGGESLVVGDSNEAWVFHVLSDGGRSAIWCAQRVPDRQVAVVANSFTIRRVNMTARGDSVLFSDSMLSVAQARGWWAKGSPFDFTKIYSYGEYYSTGYSSRRMWRAMSLLAPSLKLQPTLSAPLWQSCPWPWAVQPDRPITARTLMAIHRDTYSNTSFDMSAGLAAGPWGLPVRFDPEQAYNGQLNGNWERPIGSFRTAYTAVLQLRTRGVGSVLNFAPHTSLGSTFVPVFQGALSSPKQAGALVVADPRGVVRAPTSSRSRTGGRRVDRTSLYWAVRYAINLCYARYRDMHPYVADRQEEWEAEAAATVARLDATALAGTTVSPSQLAETSDKHAQAVLADWWDLTDSMILDWSDGFYKENMTGVDVEYPRKWLKAVGYENGPANPVPNLP